MAKFDWRSADSYSEALNYDAAAFAWEYLRRNPEYRSDYAALVGSISLATRDTLAMRRRWGVCFRAGP
jgi:hypothetical protein